MSSKLTIEDVYLGRNRRRKSGLVYMRGLTGKPFRIGPPQPPIRVRATSAADSPMRGLAAPSPGVAMGPDVEQLRQFAVPGGVNFTPSPTAGAYLMPENQRRLTVQPRVVGDAGWGQKMRGAVAGAEQMSAKLNAQDAASRDAARKAEAADILQQQMAASQREADMGRIPPGDVTPIGPAIPPMDESKTSFYGNRRVQRRTGVFQGGQERLQPDMVVRPTQTMGRLEDLRDGEWNVAMPQRVPAPSQPAPSFAQSLKLQTPEGNPQPIGANVRADQFSAGQVRGIFGLQAGSNGQESDAQRAMREKGNARMHRGFAAPGERARMDAQEDRAARSASQIAAINAQNTPGVVRDDKGNPVAFGGPGVTFPPGTVESPGGSTVGVTPGVTPLPRPGTRVIKVPIANPKTGGPMLDDKKRPITQDVIVADVPEDMAGDATGADAAAVGAPASSAWDRFKRGEFAGARGIGEAIGNKLTTLKRGTEKGEAQYVEAVKAAWLKANPGAQWGDAQEQAARQKYQKTGG